MNHFAAEMLRFLVHASLVMTASSVLRTACNSYEHLPADDTLMLHAAFGRLMLTLCL